MGTDETTALGMLRNALGASKDASCAALAAEASVKIMELRYNLAERTAQLHQATFCPALMVWWRLSDDSLGYDLTLSNPGEGGRWQRLNQRL